MDSGLVWEQVREQAPDPRVWVAGAGTYVTTERSLVRLLGLSVSWVPTPACQGPVASTSDCSRACLCALLVWAPWALHSRGSQTPGGSAVGVDEPPDLHVGEQLPLTQPGVASTPR